MYPSTTFVINDESYIQALVMPEEDTMDRPYFGQVFASPKGPEEWMNGLMGAAVTDYYGIPSFKKYGQPFLQAVMLASAGARLVTKRVVSPDATLANILVYAELTQVTSHKMDNDGLPLYYTITGDQTNIASNANDDTTGVPYFGTPEDAILMNGKDCVTESHLKITFHAEPYSNGTKDAIDMVKNWETPIINDSNFDYSAAPGSVGVENQFAPANNITPDTANAVYPLFIITDNGRGASNKSFAIKVDETARRPVNYIRYILTIYEAGKQLEEMAFTFNPDQIEGDNNIGIYNSIKTHSRQVRCVAFDDSIKALMEQVALFTDSAYNTIAKQDILFGTDIYGKSINGIEIENYGGFTFNTTAASPGGIALEGGANDSGTGDWDNPITAVDYDAQLCNAFSETFDDCIYDLDNFPIHMIADANYSQDVKHKIAEYVNWRDDVYYMRDMGITGNTTATEIINYNKAHNLGTTTDEYGNTYDYESRAIGTYMNYAQVKDPISKKRITVTMTYIAALRFVNHYINGINRPFCGIRYDVTFPEVIEGTLNYAPKVTPSGNQKQIIDDARLNYAGWYDGVLTMETQYTSQGKNTELDYMSNVLVLQNLIREIRKKCPKIRYAFFTDNNTDGSANTLEQYISDVQSVIDKCAPNFASINLVYERNNVYENNKIFYASINVSNPDWIQSERFKITVLQNT